ncbi:hypothetical protein PA01_19030 [Azoarcus sp. PA01]|nr:hypothetical protein PA01_19030 [Azoarcus sp. PA01]
MPFRVRFFPHNDLLNLAWHHLSTVEEKLIADHQEGITLDCMSCLLALGVAVEAIVNFVGTRILDDWPERRNFPQKLQLLAETLHIPLDHSVDPLRTIGIIREVRNSMAHGRPMEFQSPAKSRGELRAAMAAPWGAHATPEFARHGMQQVRTFRNDLFAAANIRHGSALTSAIGGLQ